MKRHSLRLRPRRMGIAITLAALSFLAGVTGVQGRAKQEDASAAARAARFKKSLGGRMTAEQRESYLTLLREADQQAGNRRISEILPNLTTTIPGMLNSTDPTFNRPNSFDQGEPCVPSESTTPYRTFQYTLTCPSNLIVSLTPEDGATITPSGADTFLALYGPGGFNPASPCANAIAANDDSSGLLSRISTTTPLAPGTYTIVVTSFSDGSGGGEGEPQETTFPWSYNLVVIDSCSAPVPAKPLYVTDTDNSRVQVFNGTNWALVPGSTGVVGSGAGQFRSPEAVTATAGGAIYVADTLNNRIHWYNGSVWRDFATIGLGLNQVRAPQGVTLDATGAFLFVADTGNNRIMRFNAATPGAPGVILANPGSGSSQVFSPRGLAIDAAGTLYVADTGNNRISRITNATTAGPGNATVLLTRGPGLAPAQVNAPEGVAVDSGGNLFIADTANSRIIGLSASGGTIPVGSNAFLVAGSGSGIGQVNRPEGVAVVGNPIVGRPFGAITSFLYVSDTGNNRIQVRALSGGSWSVQTGSPGQTGSVGTGIGQFRGPSKIQ